MSLLGLILGALIRLRQPLYNRAYIAYATKGFYNRQTIQGIYKGLRDVANLYFNISCMLKAQYSRESLA